MLLLILFGGALTLLTTNGHVAGVILVAHVGGSVLFAATSGGTGIGASLAIAGVIAATVVRTAVVLAGGTSSGAVDRFVGGTFAVLVIAFFAATSLTGTLYLPIADDHFGGWLCGGIAETVWIGWTQRTGN